MPSWGSSWSSFVSFDFSAEDGEPEDFCAEDGEPGDFFAEGGTLIAQSVFRETAKTKLVANFLGRNA